MAHFALFLCLGAAHAAEPEGTQYAGRPVVEVLADLRGPGLEFIYSSERLPPSLLVREEPASSNRLLAAREILAPHGLALSAVRPGLYAVVAATDRSGSWYVRGRVRAAEDGAPVGSARVQLLPVGAADWTGAGGRFAVGPAPEGDYVLRVDADGYEPVELRAVAVREGAPELEIRLAPSETRLSEVVVSTSRYAADRAGAHGALRIDGDALAIQPVIGEDALRALGRLPGIAQNGLSAQTNVRGGEAGDQMTLLDGFPLREAYHLPGYQSVFSVIDPGLVADAVVYTGGFPVRYGNRMGGIFDLRTVDAESPPRSALGLSVFNAMGRHGGRLEAVDVDWLAVGRVGTLSPIAAMFGRKTTDPTYSDVYARAGYGDPERLRVTASVLWSRDKLSIEREGYGEQAEIESRNRYLWLRADREWATGVAASLLLGHSTIDGDRRGTIDQPDISAGSVEDHRSSQYREALARAEWQPNERNWLEGGVEWTDEGATYRYAASATYTDAVAALFSRDAILDRATDLTPDRQRVAAFAAHRWQFRDSLTSEIGVRAQRTITAGTTAEEWLVDPRLNLRWELAPGTSLRAHWGRFHQTDEVHELKVEDGLTMFPEAQEADHFIVGADHRLPSGIQIRLELFRKLQRHPRPRFENQLDPLTVLPEIAPDRVEVAPNHVEARGVEFSAIYEGPRLSWWGSLAWSDAWDGIDGARTPRSWDQTWALTAGVDWVRGDWRFGAVASSHRGWPTTLIEDSMLGPRNEARFPTRAALDLRAEYRRPLAVGSLAFTVELINAVNVGNDCCYKLLAEDDGSGEVTFTTSRSDWLPLVPTLGVLWEF
jgi:hypothetical protein